MTHLPPPSYSMPMPMPGPMTIPNGIHHIEANGGDRFNQKPVPRSFIIAMSIINAITQVLLGCIVFAAFMYANSNVWNIIETFPWQPVIVWPSVPSWAIHTYVTEHIYLCVFGYVILMSQAILTFTPHAGWGNNLEHQHKRLFHAAMQILGSLLAVIGSVLKIIGNPHHGRSAHGVIGIIAMVLTIICLINGVFNLVYPKQTKSNVFKTCHGCLGSLTITMALTALIFAFHTSFRDYFGNVNANLAITASVGAAAGILAAACTRIFRRLDG